MAYQKGGTGLIQRGTIVMTDEKMCFDKENGYYLENLILDGAKELRQNLGCDWSARMIEKNITKMGNAWVALEGIQQWLQELNQSQLGGSGDILAKFLAEEITRRTGVKV